MRFTTKAKVALAAVPATLMGTLAHAQADAQLTAATTSFTAFLTDNLPVIGGALIGGAAIAVGWKWLKGMIFS